MFNLSLLLSDATETHPGSMAGDRCSARGSMAGDRCSARGSTTTAAEQVESFEEIQLTTRCDHVFSLHPCYPWSCDRVITFNSDSKRCICSLEASTIERRFGMIPTWANHFCLGISWLFCLSVWSKIGVFQTNRKNSAVGCDRSSLR